MAGTERTVLPPWTADFVVVGGGTSGAIVAARLAEQGRSVILIEAGPDFPSVEETPEPLRLGAFSEGRVTTRDFSWHWATELTSPDGKPFVLYSGRTIGGGSSVNGQVWLRGLPADFDDVWAPLGADDWTWSDVAPWYARTDRDVDFPAAGGSGSVPAQRVPREKWHPLHSAFLAGFLGAGLQACANFNEPGARGVGAQPFNNIDGVRVSTAFSHLLPARSLPGLRILSKHMADRVLFDGDRAVGVHVAAGDGSGFDVLAGQETILAAGAIGTPWLLLRSGVGDAEQLRLHGVPVVADVPAVGDGLREHPQLAVKWRARAGKDLDFTARRSPVAVRLTAPGSAIADDLKMSVQTFTDDGGEGIQVAVFLMLALSSGSVGISPDGVGKPPVVDIGFLRHPEDLRRLREAIRLAVQVAETSELAAFVGERITPTDEELGDDDALDRWLLREVQGTYHPSSTCAIGRVVDQAGLVTGLRGLRIVDASIMPDSIRANLNATVSMIAERLADAVLSRS
ncbi:MAG TPA: GMC family oxidoreductase [Naasia sp.]|jgi:choline dehydrogenase